MTHRHATQSGFSLVELTLVLSIISIIGAGVLVGTLSGQALDKVEITVNRMLKIEEALSGFTEAYNRLPCPADGSAAPDTSTYGKEGTTPGTCTGASFPTTAGVVGGTVPTRTLGLPDDYMLDGWGRRFTYVVDVAATTNVDGSTEAVQINGPAVNATEAIISHGQNGDGAFPANGSAVDSRFTSGSTDANELENGPATQAAFNNIFYQGDRTSSFDDIVRYQISFPIVP